MQPIDNIKNNLPGAILSVCASGEGIQHYCSGMADVEKGIELTPEHIFQNGRITRTFTAAVALKLVESGLLDLEAPLELLANQHRLDSGRLRLIVDLYPYLKPVTLRELLNQTSGIPSYDETLAYQRAFFSKPKKVWQAESYLDLITGEKIRYRLGYTPSVRGIFSDSTTNYIIVSLLLEAATGQCVSQQMRGFFDAQGLSDTYYATHGVLEESLLPRLAHGYLPLSHPHAQAFKRAPVLTYNNNRELRVYDVTSAYNFNGLGGSASMGTTTDLIHAFGNLMRGKILTGSLKEMFNAVPVNPKVRLGQPQDYYGLGLYKTISKSHGEIVWNAGNSYGYGVMVAYSIERDIVFALALNVGRQVINLHNIEIVSAVLSNLLGDQKNGRSFLG